MFSFFDPPPVREAPRPCRAWKDADCDSLSHLSQHYDPPVVAGRLWNTCFSDPGAVILRSPSLLEYFTFAKPYFEPEGFQIAAVG